MLCLDLLVYVRGELEYHWAHVHGIAMPFLIKLVVCIMERERATCSSQYVYLSATDEMWKVVDFQA